MKCILFVPFQKTHKCGSKRTLTGTWLLWQHLARCSFSLISATFSNISCSSSTCCFHLDGKGEGLVVRAALQVRLSLHFFQVCPMSVCEKKRSVFVAWEAQILSIVSSVHREARNETSACELLEWLWTAPSSIYQKVASKERGWLRWGAGSIPCCIKKAHRLGAKQEGDTTCHCRAIFRFCFYSTKQGQRKERRG